MHYWIHDKYSYTSFKKQINMTKLFFSSCVSVWCSGQVVACTRVSWVRLPRHCFLYLCTFSFFLFGLFLPLLFLLAFFFFILTAHLASHPLGSISGVLIWKRDFKSWKSSWSAYWPSLRPEKNISCQDMSLLWNSWIFFFNVSWHHDKQHTVHLNWTNLYPTPASDPLAKVKLAFVHRLNHQYYYPRISTGSAPKK